jgi:hypothetical protein
MSEQVWICLIIRERFRLFSIKNKIVSIKMSVSSIQKILSKLSNSFIVLISTYFC